LISGFDLSTTSLKGSSNMDIFVDGKKVDADVSRSKNIIIWETSDGSLNVGYDKNIWKGDVIRVEPSGENDESVIEVIDYEKRPSWNPTLNDNKFRGAVEFRVVNDGMKLINELGIESYLLGLAEVPDSELLEKAKTIVVAARSYAYYYSNGDGKGLKYKGKPYHLNDSPESSQKYLGYGFEERSSLNKKAVLATEGETITWFGYDVVIPYFSESDGRTRTATEVWGWSRFKSPYLTSVDDSYCKGGNGSLWGHGVGISGCGASGMAAQGFDYEEIINYYLNGIEISKKY
jgi:peptidoglycan hydrolase-like amidase